MQTWNGGWTWVREYSESAEDLVRLSQHPEALVRLGVATDPRTGIEILIRLVQDPDWRVWNEAIHHAEWLKHLDRELPLESLSAELICDWASLSTCPNGVLEYYKEKYKGSYFPAQNRRGGLGKPSMSTKFKHLEEIDDAFATLPRGRVVRRDLPKYARSVKLTADQRFLAVIEDGDVWFNLLRNPALTKDALEILKANDAILGDIPDVFFVDLENDTAAPASLDLTGLWEVSPDHGMVKNAEYSENLTYKASV